MFEVSRPQKSSLKTRVSSEHFAEEDGWLSGHGQIILIPYLLTVEVAELLIEMLVHLLCVVVLKSVQVVQSPRGVVPS
jgi:cadmium resistance protein CadD (predicted permease)